MSDSQVQILPLPPSLPRDLVWIRFDVALADLSGVMRIFKDGFQLFNGDGPGTYAVGMTWTGDQLPSLEKKK